MLIREEELHPFGRQDRLDDGQQNQIIRSEQLDH